MASPLLDLKKYKHVKTDDNFTTLRHTDGHLLKLSHKALSKANQTMLNEMRSKDKGDQDYPQNRMADGGETKIATGQEASPSAQNSQRGQQIAQASQKGGTPSDSPLATGDWSRIWKANGGKVAESGGNPKLEESKKVPPENTLDYRQLHKEKRAMNIKENNSPVMPSGKRLGYADGGETSLMATNQLTPYERNLPCLNPNCKSHGRPHPNCRCYGGMAEGGEVIHYCRFGYPHKSDCEYSKMAEGGPATANPQDASKAAQASQKGGAPSDSPISTGDWSHIWKAEGGDVEKKENIPSRDKNDYSPEIGEQADQMLNKEEATADQQGQQAVIPEPPQAQPQMQGSSPAQPQMQSQPQGQSQLASMPVADDALSRAHKQLAQTQDDWKNETLNEGAKFEHDLANQKITPKTYADLYADRKSVFGKLALGLGTIMGGMSTVHGAVNPVIKMMDDQIKRDLEAQEKNIDNKKSFYQLHLNNLNANSQIERLHNENLLTDQQAVGLAMDNRNKAYQNTYQDSWNSAFHNMLDTINKIPDPANRAKALNAVGMMYPEVQKLILNSADQRAAMGAHMRNQLGAPAAVTQQPGVQEQNQPMSQKPSDKKTPQEGQASVYKLLAPGSQQKYNTVMGGFDPVWSKNKDLINQQYTQAQQAEKVLNGPKNDGKGGIHDILNQMQEAQSNMGLYGHMHGKLEQMGESLPIIGGAAGAATQMFPQTHSEKQFYALQSSLESDLSSALNGLMTPTDIHHLVGKYSPAYQDTPKDVAFKEEQIVNTVKKALRSGALGGAGFLRDK